MRDILNEIVVHKRQEVEQNMINQPLDILQEEIRSYSRAKLSMRRSLEQSTTGIIAEFKRRSPSKGWISEGADCVNIVSGYASSGAVACSVLIDGEYFGGSVDDLCSVRDFVPHTPLLYKEFIVDPYQLFQARLSGADAVLLIAACLTPKGCADLAASAHELGLEVLLEIHTAEELDHITENVDMLGVNNRHLGTFHTDVNQSFALAESMQRSSTRLAHQPLLISESGISRPETILALREVGFRGFLMGETFMKSADPAAELSTLISHLT